jgi:hypothetical protein
VVLNVCNENRVDGTGHYCQQREEKSGVVSVDYAYMKQIQGTEETEEDGIPVLIVNDRDCKRAASHVVFAKGVNLNFVGESKIGAWDKSSIGRFAGGFASAQWGRGRGS